MKQISLNCASQVENEGLVTLLMRVYRFESMISRFVTSDLIQGVHFLGFTAAACTGVPSVTMETHLALDDDVTEWHHVKWLYNDGFKTAVWRDTEELVQGQNMRWEQVTSILHWPTCGRSQLLPTGDDAQPSKSDNKDPERFPVNMKQAAVNGTFI